MNSLQPVVWVSGHSQGLGRAVAKTFLQQGWRVLGISRRRWEDAEAAAHPGLTQVALDLSDAVAVTQWLEGSPAAASVAGAERVCLINNAGTVAPIGLAGSLSASAIAKAVGLNVSAALVLTDAFLALTHRAADRRVVHVSSGAARSPYAGWSVYCTTKAALDMHANVLALESATRAGNASGLRIESLAPGVVDTNMQAYIRQTSSAQFPSVDRFKGSHAQGQLQSPETVAEALVRHVLSLDFGSAPIRDLRTVGNGR